MVLGNLSKFAFTIQQLLLLTLTSGTAVRVRAIDFHVEDAVKALHLDDAVHALHNIESLLLGSSVSNGNGDGGNIIRSDPSDLSVSSLLSDLGATNTKFYVYDDEDDMHVKSQSVLPDTHDPNALLLLDHILEDERAELETLWALLSHPLRTLDESDAEVFVVPTPISRILASGCLRRDCTTFDAAFTALAKRPAFVRNGGADHVIVSYSWVAFNRRFAHMVPALSMSYKLLENVTVAGHCDYYSRAEDGTVTSTTVEEDDGFKVLLEEERPASSPGFSIGLGVDANIPLQKPSWDKFVNSELFLFYHTRADQPFEFGSQPFRMAPLSIDFEGSLTLPKSSVGNDIAKQDYDRSIVRSKFCLIVRGDTPHAHAFFRAIRAGCLPVIVSDRYQDYAGPFKSSLAMKDFSISIDETTFLADPAKALLALQDVPEETLRMLLKNLEVVQTILFPQEELFVQAFLKESLATFEKKSSDEKKSIIEKSSTSSAVSTSTFFSCDKSWTYVYPTSLESRSPFLIVGVFSSASNKNARHNVRTTWGDNHRSLSYNKHNREQHEILFIVAGPWKDVEAEFRLYGDLLWVDMEESYHDGLVPKRDVLLHVAKEHIKNYEYLLKTDDDSFVDLDELAEKLLPDKVEVDYWGHCVYDANPFRDPSSKWYVSENEYAQDLYPPYALGLGYVMSRSFVDCGVDLFTDNSFFYLEDVATGFLAQQCGIPCIKEGFNLPNSKNDIILHGLKGDWDMDKAHWDAKKRKGRTGSNSTQLQMNTERLLQSGTNSTNSTNSTASPIMSPPPPPPPPLPTPPPTPPPTFASVLGDIQLSPETCGGITAANAAQSSGIFEESVKTYTGNSDDGTGTVQTLSICGITGDQMRRQLRSSSQSSMTTTTSQTRSLQTTDNSFRFRIVNSAAADDPAILRVLAQAVGTGAFARVVSALSAQAGFTPLQNAIVLQFTIENLPSAGTVVYILFLFYPDWKTSYNSPQCLHDGNEPLYMTSVNPFEKTHYLTTSPNECCRRWFQYDVAGCLEASSADTQGVVVVSVGSSLAGFYPSWNDFNDETLCLRDGKEPQYMIDNPFFLKDNIESCCSSFFLSRLQECIDNGGTSSSNSTSSNTVEGFAPNFEGGEQAKCVNVTESDSTPAYILGNPAVWIFDDITSCCTQYFSWAFGECLGNSDPTGAASAAAVSSPINWYIDWEMMKCVKDCPPSSSDTACGGLKNEWGESFSSADACCSQGLYWIDANGCLAS